MNKKALSVFLVLLILGIVILLAMDDQSLIRSERGTSESEADSRQGLARRPRAGAESNTTAWAPEKSEAESLYVLTEVARIADRIEAPTDEPDRSTEELARLGSTLGAGELKLLRDFNLRSNEPFIERFVALNLIKAAPENEAKTEALTTIASSPTPERSEVAVAHSDVDASAMQENILRKLAMDALAAQPSSSLAIRALEQVAQAQTNKQLRRQATLLADLLRRGELDDYRRHEENILAHAADSE